jgi:hypothetical protein
MVAVGSGALNTRNNRGEWTSLRALFHSRLVAIRNTNRSRQDPEQQGAVLWENHKNADKTPSHFLEID